MCLVSCNKSSKTKSKSFHFISSPSPSPAKMDSSPDSPKILELKNLDFKVNFAILQLYSKYSLFILIRHIVNRKTDKGWASSPPEVNYYCCDNVGQHR